MASVTSPFGDVAKFRDEETVINTNRATRKPQMALDMPDTDPDRTVLTKEQNDKAKKALVSSKKVSDFPRAIAYNTDPAVPQQNYAIISFIPSKKAIPDKDGGYGMLKVRGVFSTINEAESRSDFLLKSHDSWFEQDICSVGVWVPLMKDNSAYVEATKEIDIRKKHTEEVKEGQKTKKNEEEQSKKDIAEKQQKLMDASHSTEKEEDDPESIDYFIKIKSKRGQALAHIENAEIEIAKARKVVDSADNEISSLLAKHPEFADEYLARYENAKRAVGISPDLDQLHKFMK